MKQNGFVLHMADSERNETLGCHWHSSIIIIVTSKTISAQLDTETHFSNRLPIGGDLLVKLSKACKKNSRLYDCYERTKNKMQIALPCSCLHQRITISGILSPNIHTSTKIQLQNQESHALAARQGFSFSWKQQLLRLTFRLKLSSRNKCFLCYAAQFLHCYRSPATWQIKRGLC